MGEIIPIYRMSLYMMSFNHPVIHRSMKTMDGLPLRDLLLEWINLFSSHVRISNLKINEFALLTILTNT